MQCTQCNNKATPPPQERAAYQWYSNRAQLASQWVWLQAQVHSPPVYLSVWLTWCLSNSPDICLSNLVSRCLTWSIRSGSTRSCTEPSERAKALWPWGRRLSAGPCMGSRGPRGGARGAQGRGGQPATIHRAGYSPGGIAQIIYTLSYTPVPIYIYNQGIETKAAEARIKRTQLSKHTIKVKIDLHADRDSPSRLRGAGMIRGGSILYHSILYCAILY